MTYQYEINQLLYKLTETLNLPIITRDHLVVILMLLNDFSTLQRINPEFVIKPTAQDLLIDKLTNMEKTIRSNLEYDISESNVECFRGNYYLKGNYKYIWKSIKEFAKCPAYSSLGGKYSTIDCIKLYKSLLQPVTRLLQVKVIPQLRKNLKQDPFNDNIKMMNFIEAIYNMDSLFKKKSYIEFFSCIIIHHNQVKAIYESLIDELYSPVPSNDKIVQYLSQLKDINWLPCTLNTFTQLYTSKLITTVLSFLLEQKIFDIELKINNCEYANVFQLIDSLDSDFEKITRFSQNNEYSRLKSLVIIKGKTLQEIKNLCQNIANISEADLKLLENTDMNYYIFTTQDQDNDLKLLNLMLAEVLENTDKFTIMRIVKACEGMNTNQFAYYRSQLGDLNQMRNEEFELVLECCLNDVSEYLLYHQVFDCKNFDNNIDTKKYDLIIRSIKLVESFRILSAMRSEPDEMTRATTPNIADEINNLIAIEFNNIYHDVLRSIHNNNNSIIFEKIKVYTLSEFNKLLENIEKEICSYLKAYDGIYCEKLFNKLAIFESKLTHPDLRTLSYNKLKYLRYELNDNRSIVIMNFIFNLNLLDFIKISPFLVIYKDDEIMVDIFSKSMFGIVNKLLSMCEIEMQYKYFEDLMQTLLNLNKFTMLRNIDMYLSMETLKDKIIGVENFAIDYLNNHVTTVLDYYDNYYDRSIIPLYRWLDVLKSFSLVVSYPPFLAPAINNFLNIYPKIVVDFEYFLENDNFKMISLNLKALKEYSTLFAYYFDLKIDHQDTINPEPLNEYMRNNISYETAKKQIQEWFLDLKNKVKQYQYQCQYNASNYVLHQIANGEHSWLYDCIDGDVDVVMGDIFLKHYKVCLLSRFMFDDSYDDDDNIDDNSDDDSDGDNDDNDNDNYCYCQ